MLERRIHRRLAIRGGTVYDGTGAPPVAGDVLVEGDRIAAVGEVTPAALRDAESIDAAGLAVAPGFIDVHSHSDAALLHPDAVDVLSPFVRQGVTTQVIGNCGLGVAPAPPERRAALAGFMALIVPEGLDWSWNGFDDYLEGLQRSPLPVNVVPLAAHGALRAAVLGARPGPARGAALERIVAELDAALAAGAFGLSAGLIYPPGLWADTGEIEALCRRVAETDGIFTCHVRGSSETALQAEEELLALARRTGVRTQHSHHEAFGEPFWDRARQTLRLEDRARRRGLDVASDVIPYHAVNTTLLAVYPPWALEGGVSGLIRRLGDPTIRRRIGREIRERAPEWPPWENGWAHNLVRATGWDNIVVLQAAAGARPEWAGRSFAEISRREGRPAFECAADLTVAAGGDVMARYHGVSGSPERDDVLRELLVHPHHAVGIDVILKGDGIPHPGGWGAMPRWLGTYARDRGWVGLPEAIRKITSLPAARFGLRDRGRIAPGAAADLVVFDPQEIGETGSYDRPARTPRGIHHVLLGGRAAVRDGRTLAIAGGRLLRRPDAGA